MRLTWATQQIRFSGPKGMTPSGNSLRARHTIVFSCVAIFAGNHAAYGFENIHQTQYPDYSIVPGNQQRHEVSGYQLMHSLLQRTALIDQFFFAWCMKQILDFHIYRFISDGA